MQFQSYPPSQFLCCSWFAPNEKPGSLANVAHFRQLMRNWAVPSAGKDGSGNALHGRASVLRWLCKQQVRWKRGQKEGWKKSQTHQENPQCSLQSSCEDPFPSPPATATLRASAGCCLPWASIPAARSSSGVVPTLRARHGMRAAGSATRLSGGQLHGAA